LARAKISKITGISVSMSTRKGKSRLGGTDSTTAHSQALVMKHSFADEAFIHTDSNTMTECPNSPADNRCDSPRFHRPWDTLRVIPLFSVLKREPQDAAWEAMHRGSIVRARCQISTSAATSSEAGAELSREYRFAYSLDTTKYISIPEYLD
jgi:hypothetical protein